MLEQRKGIAYAGDRGYPDGMTTDVLPGETANFGPWLKENRMKRGMTQTQLADACFVSQETISKLEGGRQRPAMNFCMDLARVFRLAIDEVLLAAGIITEDDVRVFTRRAKSGVNALAKKLLDLPEWQQTLAIAICNAVVDTITREGALADRQSTKIEKRLVELTTEAERITRQLREATVAFGIPTVTADPVDAPTQATGGASDPGQDADADAKG
jgi:DNA-binding XRE family transcriptional regulator